MSKKLVAYFSATGTTEAVAKIIAASTGADLFAIRPATPYTAKDLDWRDSQSRSSLEMTGKLPVPDLDEDLPDNIEDYDVIFLGFPIWWHVAPTIVHSFLMTEVFEGKTIVLFATSGESGFGATSSELKPLLPDSATLVEGIVLHGVSEQAIGDWLATLRL